MMMIFVKTITVIIIFSSKMEKSKTLFSGCYHLLGIINIITTDRTTTTTSESMKMMKEHTRKGETNDDAEKERLKY